jgi:NAD(P)-dependent dehydrogenase (short-subunit alcohol dehydrogenase family)
MTHILVTGASGGIGAAICKALALRGVTVVRQDSYLGFDFGALIGWL